MKVGSVMINFMYSVLILKLTKTIAFTYATYIVCTYTCILSCCKLVIDTELASRRQLFLQLLKGTAASKLYNYIAKVTVENIAKVTVKKIIDFCLLHL